MNGDILLKVKTKQNKKQKKTTTLNANEYGEMATHKQLKVI